VRAVLLRPLYRGEIVWNKSRKRDSWGRAKRSDRAEDAWLRVPAPQLRIVSDELWTAAHRERRRRESQYAAGDRGHRASRYLLSGLARCAVCGGGFASHSRAHGKHHVLFYGCTTHWKRGACTNGLVGRMEAIDAEVLATLQDDILRPSVIEQAIAIALEELSPQRQDRAHRALDRELADVRAECDRLAEAIGRGGPLDALLERLRARQARRQELEQYSPRREWSARLRPVPGLSYGSERSSPIGAGSFCRTWTAGARYCARCSWRRYDSRR
jgi:site-specific DNA recombinase